MIPNLTIIIAAYICFRAIETMLRSESSFHSFGAYAFAVFAAVATILVTVVMTFETISSAANIHIPNL
jgi:hypothetical protein